MSRENFVLKLTLLDNTPVYVAIGNIFGMVEVAKAKDKEAHTIVSGPEGFGYEVSETVAQIKQKGEQHGVLFIVGA